MTSMEPEEFQELLDQHYQWPAEYMFKFIVKSDLLDKIQKLEEIFASLDLIEQTTRSSHGGKYTAYSLRCRMLSSAAVIDVYERVSHIEGVVAL